MDAGARDLGGEGPECTIPAGVDGVLHADTPEAQDEAAVELRHAVGEARRRSKVSSALSALMERRTAAASMPGRFPLDRPVTELAIAFVLDETGQQARAIGQFEHAADVNVPAADVPVWRVTHLSACALIGATWACHRVLRVDHGLALSGRALETARGLGIPRLVADACVAAAQIHLDARQCDACHRLASEGVTVAQRAGARAEQASGQDVLGQLAVERGELLEAIGAFGEALVLFEELGCVEGRVSVLRHTGDAYLHIGESARALAFYQRSLRLAESVNDVRGQLIAHSRVCRAHIASEDLTMARRALAQSIRLDLRLKHEIAQAYMHLLEAELSNAEGESSRAATHAEQAYRLFSQQGDTYHAALATHQRGLASAGERNFGGADRLFGEAVEAFRRLGAPADLAHTLLDLGKIRLTQGELAPAVEALRDAMQTADETELRAVHERCRQVIGSVPCDLWMRTIVQLHTAKQEAEELLAYRESMAHLVAHDLRSPTTNVRVSLDHVLSQDPTMSAEGREELTSARDHCDVLLSRIATMMQAYCMQRHSLKITPEPTNVEGLIERAWGLIGRTARSGTEFTLERAGHVPDAMADAELVQRALENLLSNAARYAGSGGATPHISAGVVYGLTPGMLRVYIRDNGPGVPEDMREAIFDPGVRVQPGVSRQGNTGLGLHFVRLVADAHGGRVWVESPVSGGSVFCLELPEWPGQGGTAD